MDLVNQMYGIVDFLVEHDMDSHVWDAVGELVVQAVRDQIRFHVVDAIEDAFYA